MKQQTVLFILLVLPFQLFAQSVDELILNKQYDKALERISVQIQEKPESELFFKQAIVYKEQSKPLLACKSLEQAIFYDPQNSLYQAELGENYSSLGNVYQTVECYRRAVDLAPNDLGLKGKLGRAYLSIDDFKKAYQTFEAIYKVDSTNVYFNKQFAFAAFRTGKTDQAIRLYNRVVTENPGDFGSHLNLIAVYKRKKEADMVYSSGVRALSVFPGNPIILRRQAEALFELKDYERAVFPFEQYLMENDSTIDVLTNYGVALYLSENLEKALPILEKCFYIVPNDQYINFYIGLIYKSFADYPRSAEYLASAIECAQPPYLSKMYHHLGQVYGSSREFEKSISALEKAYELDNESFEILFEIATTYEEYNFNKTLALNYYSIYLKTAGVKAKNADYALGRMRKIKEDLFFENK
ncbi:MAG: tetratricopeptide repeat protein [Prolixibacteraceae bacterium]|nr:tetratricopeptide repeat protein [Prolixibacteraceae bacterium]